MLAETLETTPAQYQTFRTVELLFASLPWQRARSRPRRCYFLLHGLRIAQRVANHNVNCATGLTGLSDALLYGLHNHGLRWVGVTPAAPHLHVRLGRQAFAHSGISHIWYVSHFGQLHGHFGTLGLTSDDRVLLSAGLMAHFCRSVPRSCSLRFFSLLEKTVPYLMSRGNLTWRHKVFQG